MSKTHKKNNKAVQKEVPIRYKVSKIVYTHTPGTREKKNTQKERRMKNPRN